MRMAHREDWNYGLGPPFMVLNEDVDATRASPHWRSAAGGSDPTTWPMAEVVTMRSKMLPCLEPSKLTERPIPPMTEIPRRFDRVVRCSHPSMASAWTDLIHRGTALVLPPRTTAWVELEVDHYTTAYTTLHLSSGSGTRVEIMCSECYEAPMSREGPGAQRVKGNRKDHENGRLYGPINSYTTHDGVNAYEPFWFSSFRFVRLEVTTSDQIVQLLLFSFRVTNYSLVVETEIITCPPDLKKLYDVSMDTLRNCMHETYEDCPFYEQNQFLMDSRLQMLFTYQISRDDRLARKTMHEFHASRREDGLLQAHFPSPGRTINIPLFSLFFVAMVHDHMLYFRDETLVRKYLGTIDGVLEHFARLVQGAPFDALVGRFRSPEDWAFADWVAEWTVGPPVHGMATPPAYHHDPGSGTAPPPAGGATIFSLVYAWALRLAADLADVVHRCDTATEYRQRAQTLCDAVNRHCFDRVLALYTDGPRHASYSQHCQVFAVLAGATTGTPAADLMLRTARAVSRHSAHDAGGTSSSTGAAAADSSLPMMARCSYAMSFYVFRAARLTGVYEQLWPEMIAPWHAMLADNLVTFAESESMPRSDCHGWSAGPIYEVVAEVFGVKPRLDGALEVRPKLCLLRQRPASAKIVTAKGPLTVSCDEAGRVFLDAGFEVFVYYGDSQKYVTLEKGKAVCVEEV